MTLVLGGTGKTGRRVVERLKARNMPVRMEARSGKTPFDWETDRSIQYKQICEKGSRQRCLAGIEDTS